MPPIFPKCLIGQANGNEKLVNRTLGSSRFQVEVAKRQEMHRKQKRDAKGGGLGDSLSRLRREEVRGGKKRPGEGEGEEQGRGQEVLWSFQRAKRRERVQGGGDYEYLMAQGW